MNKPFLASLLKVCKWGFLLLAVLSVMFFSYRVELKVKWPDFELKLEPIVKD